MRDATAFVLENRTNLLTMPPFHRGIGVCGEGGAAALLRGLPWLSENRVVYWGDIDVDGFQILSHLRGFLPDGRVQSVMMDVETLGRHAAFIVERPGPGVAEPPRLTDEERAAFRQCAERRQRLEQEKIPQAYVEARIGALATGL